VADAVRLQLMMGPGVPVPAPRVVLDALDQVKVESGSGQTQSGFELTLKIQNTSPLETLFLLTGGSSIPIFRVVIAVTLGGTTSVLMDGVMTHHELRSDGGPTSTLTVKGKDLTALMDIIQLDGLPYPAMPPALRVLVAVSKYAAFGVIPLVIPSVLEDVPIPIERIPRHQGTDYAYIKALADEVGYVFYIDPGPAPGANVAYWGPEVKFGVPQPALNVNMDSASNVESLSFSYDALSKKQLVITIQQEDTQIPIPIPLPDITPLNPPLGAKPALPLHVKLIGDAPGAKETTKYPPVQAAATGLAAAAKSADVITGSGTLDVVRYGQPLRARQLVGVRGAGPAYDGLYFVKSVTHDIKHGEYKQNFTLSRNALVPLSPRIPV